MYFSRDDTASIQSRASQEVSKSGAINFTPPGSVISTRYLLTFVLLTIGLLHQLAQLGLGNAFEVVQVRRTLVGVCDLRHRHRHRRLDSQTFVIAQIDSSGATDAKFADHCQIPLSRVYLDVCKARMSRLEIYMAQKKPPR